MVWPSARFSLVTCAAGAEPGRGIDEPRLLAGGNGDGGAGLRFRVLLNGLLDLRVDRFDRHFRYSRHARIGLKRGESLTRVNNPLNL